MIPASIFLSAKIFETEHKIRDILNMIFSVTSLHRILQSLQNEEEGAKSTIQKLIAEGDLKERIQPNYSINNTPLPTQTTMSLKRRYWKQSSTSWEYWGSISLNPRRIWLRWNACWSWSISWEVFESIYAQATINTYNTGCEKWIAGVVFFGYLVGSAAERQKSVR